MVFSVLGCRSCKKEFEAKKMMGATQSHEMLFKDKVCLSKAVLLNAVLGVVPQTPS